MDLVNEKARVDSNMDDAKTPRKLGAFVKTFGANHVKECEECDVKPSLKFSSPSTKNEWRVKGLPEELVASIVKLEPSVNMILEEGVRKRKIMRVFRKEFERVTRNLEETKMTLVSLSGIVGTPTKNSNMLNLISEMGDIRDLFRNLKANFLQIEKSTKTLDSDQIQRGFYLFSDRISEVEDNVGKKVGAKKEEFEDNNKRVFELFQVLVKKQVDMKDGMAKILPG